MHTLELTKDNIEAIEDFKATCTKEFLRVHELKNWREALHWVWDTGREDRYDKTGNLRYLRNVFGPEWLETYER